VITKWLWLIAAGGFFALGIVISEVFFGWATEADLQPNIDGLSRDEVLLAVTIGLVAVLFARRWARPHDQGPPEAATDLRDDRRNAPRRG
jgi:hypothetical protein